MRTPGAVVLAAPPLGAAASPQRGQDGPAQPELGRRFFFFGNNAGFIFIEIVQLKMSM